MPHSKSKTRQPATPLPALEAALASPAADPIRHAIKLDALEQQLRPYLPPTLAAHCKLGNLSGDRLVFLVDSPVWHAKLRLASTELIAAAKSIGLTINTITVRTSPNLTSKQSTEAAAQKPSVVAQEALREALAMLGQTPADQSASTQHKRGRLKR